MSILRQKKVNCTCSVCPKVKWEEFRFNGHYGNHIQRWDKFIVFKFDQIHIGAKKRSLKVKGTTSQSRRRFYLKVERRSGLDTRF